MPTVQGDPKRNPLRYGIIINSYEKLKIRQWSYLFIKFKWNR